MKPVLALTLALTAFTGFSAQAAEVTMQMALLHNLRDAYDEMQTFAARSLKDEHRMCFESRPHIGKIKNAMKGLEAGDKELVEETNDIRRDELRANIAKMRPLVKKVVAYCNPKRDWDAPGAKVAWDAIEADLKKIRALSFKGEKLIAESGYDKHAAIDEAKIESARIEKQVTLDMHETENMLLHRDPPKTFRLDAE